MGNGACPRAKTPEVGMQQTPGVGSHAPPPRCTGTERVPG